MDDRIQSRCEREEAAHAESLRRSMERRIAAEQKRKLEWILVGPAVLGVIGLIYWVTLSMPVEQWWIGVIGVFLMIPFWTIRYGMEN